jgi:hypothetical protein
MQDDVFMDPDVQDYLTDILSVVAADDALVASDGWQGHVDNLNVAAVDATAATSSRWQDNDDKLEVHLRSSQSLSEKVKVARGEVARIRMIERTQRQEGLQGVHSESLLVQAGSLMSPTYKPHLSDGYHRPYGETKHMRLDTGLHDKYQMKGRELVQYVLGDVSKDGWPVGKFILGVNTLK